MIAAGVPAGQVLSVVQALGQEQIVHRDLLMTIPFDLAGMTSLTVPRSGFTVDGQPTSVSTSPPLLGQHNDAIFQEIGYSEHT